MKLKKIKIPGIPKVKVSGRVLRGAAAGFLSLAAMMLLFVSPPSFLRVQEIALIAPVKHLSERDLVRLSQVRKGDNLLTLRLVTVRKNLLRFPWVHEVQLFKRIPGRLLIQVEEEVPMARLELKEAEDGKKAPLYLVNQEGRIFKKVDAGDPRDLPLLTIFGTGGTGGTGGAGGTERVAELAALLRLFDRSDILRPIGVSEIQAKAGGGLSLFTRDPCLRVELGSGDWEGKIGRLGEVWASIQALPKRPKVVDLTMKKRIFVKKGG